MIKLADLYEEWPSTGRGFDLRIDRLHTLITADEWRLDIDPPYQRPHRWTTNQRSAFMGHLLGGGKVQPLIMNDVPRPLGSMETPRAELLDGKQRLTTILMWFRGEIAATCDTPTGLQSVWHHETDGRFRNGHTLHIDVVQLDEIAALRFYLRLNAGGTPHSEEDLSHVRDLLGEAQKKAAG